MKATTSSTPCPTPVVRTAFWTTRTITSPTKATFSFIPTNSGVAAVVMTAGAAAGFTTLPIPSAQLSNTPLTTPRNTSRRLPRLSVMLQRRRLAVSLTVGRLEKLARPSTVVPKKRPRASLRPLSQPARRSRKQLRRLAMRSRRQLPLLLMASRRRLMQLAMPSRRRLIIPATRSRRRPIIPVMV